MKGSKNLLLWAIVAAVIAGCASAGNEKMRNESQQSVDSKLVKGKTTKAEVTALFGSADKTSFTDGGNEIWTYSLVKATPKAINFVPIVNLFAHGADTQKKELVILFDANSVVKNYTFSETAGEIKGGITAND